MRNLSLVVLASSLVAGAALAQDIPRDQTPPVNPGPTTSKPSQPRGKAAIIGEVAIGERAPDFELDTSLGKSQKLSRLRGDWVLLLFGDRYRSLAVFDSLDVPSRRLGARIVGVCHEKQQTLTGVAARDSLQMLMFADATGEVAAMYGVYDWRYGSTDPGFFVIDREGIVRLAVIGKLFPPDQMLELVRFATGELN